MARSSDRLTTPDLVALSYLAVEPMHGYQLNVRLREHEVRDWAGISQAQVYYSLRKLNRLGLIRAVPADPDEVVIGPERQSFVTTAKGRRALSETLGREEWATQRPPPPFQTWLALSRHASPETVQGQLRRRRRYLEGQLERERITLTGIGGDGQTAVTVRLMVMFAMQQFELELRWLDEVEERLVPHDGQLNGVHEKTE
jgi:DNA-binding PadR family transcriptional regulator